MELTLNCRPRLLNQTHQIYQLQRLFQRVYSSDLFQIFAENLQTTRAIITVVVLPELLEVNVHLVLVDIAPCVVVEKEQLLLVLFRIVLLHFLYVGHHQLRGRTGGKVHDWKHESPVEELYQLGVPGQLEVAEGKRRSERLAVVQVGLELHLEIIISFLNCELELSCRGRLVYVSDLCHLRPQHLELLVIDRKVVKIQMFMCDTGLLKDFKHVERQLRKQFNQN